MNDVISLEVVSKCSVKELDELVKTAYPGGNVLKLKSAISNIDIDRALFDCALSDPESGMPKSRKDHVARVAWFSAKGWSEPVRVRLSPAGPLIVAGQHQFLAALHRGDQFINVEWVR